VRLVRQKPESQSQEEGNEVAERRERARVSIPRSPGSLVGLFTAVRRPFRKG